VSPSNPSRRRKAAPEDDAPIEGTRLEELVEATAVAPEEPDWLRAAAAPESPDPEARLTPEARAAAERHRAEVADSRRREILGRLNPEQQRAVTTTEGPVLILAGAGSGKTRVLAHRIAYLVGVQEVAPWRILAVTFTNKAAGELRDRIIRLVGEPGREVQAGTFHALCARVLRRDGEAIGLDRRFVIYDTEDQAALMKQILREEGLDPKGETRPQAILGVISRAKNDMLDPADIPPLTLATGVRVQAARLARLYQAALGRAGALDFDDLLLEAVRLFVEAPAVLARYQERWRYLHVDEYQDTNRPQYLWIRALAAQHRNLAVVGDDDQSIYGWRGADIRNILDFERDWPDSTVITLEQNYRSTQLILDAAHAVVSKNEARSAKKLWTQNATGRRIERFEAYNEEEEAEWIIRRVEELAGGRGSALTRRADDHGRVPLPEIAVLYRTNAQSRAIEEACLRYGLRYQVVGGTRFYSRREVKDALAYLRALRSDADSVSFERIINVPTRAIGEKTVGLVRAFVGREGIPYWIGLERAAAGEIPDLAARARAAIAEFVALVRRLRSRVGALPLPELLDDVLERSGYRAMLADGSEEGEERWANLLELREVTTRYDDLTAEDALDRLLEETALVADQDSYEPDADALSLITLHAAKGLEFDVVFIAGLEEGLFPTGRAVEAESGFNPSSAPLEEERRLAYVGMTRARHALFLSHAWRRATRRGPGSWMAEPSRFLLEIPPELMNGPRLGLPVEDGGLDATEDLDLVFGRGATRFGRPIRAGGGAYREGSGRPGAPRAGEAFRPSRDLAARREAFAEGAASGSLGRRPRPVEAWDEEDTVDGGRAAAVAPERRERPVIPGERRYRDGDRVRHARWGDGIVVTSRLTRDDEEVTVAFRDSQVGRKTLLATLASLDLIG
jgi:DNA helicase-2/ATP-dependent DNA helicase PcrA